MNGVYVVKMKFYVSHTNQLVIACKKSQGKKKNLKQNALLIDLF